MKRLVTPFIIPIIVLVTSCHPKDTETVLPPSITRDDTPVVEILSEYTLLLYDRPIDKLADIEFIDSDVRAAMINSRFIKNVKPSRLKLASTNQTL